MACEDMTALLHASLDDELDAEHARRVESHIRDCPSCSAELRRLRLLREAVRGHATYHRLTPARHDALRASLRRPSDPPPPRQRLGVAGQVLRRRKMLGGMAASLLIGAALGGWLGQRVGGSGNEAALTDELVGAHVRALQPGHAIDVASSDQHTVKPWFDGRADFSPPVKDLGEQGFALVGGRLDYVAHRTVAVMVYRRRQHQIDLFAWPLATTDGPDIPVSTVDGYHVRAWAQDGFRLVAVSNLNGDELDEFVQRWRAL
jgi:anti-sigma factor RsiW